MYFSIHLATSRIEHKVKPSRYGLNSVTWIGCITKAKETSLSYSLSILLGNKDSCFPKEISETQPA